MTAPAVTNAFEMVVGLEVHVQLKTATKAFCRCSADFGALPNTNVCPVCLALPGALPVLNERAVELATRAAFALGCTVHPTSIFARKNYFYPDLPKGYQISQFDKPLATGGSVRIGTTESGAPISVGVTRVHMEEDAGKSIHDRYPGATAIDLNRAGVPLIEIVSEPDMRSVTEASAYLRLVKQLLEYMAVSDVSMEQGEPARRCQRQRPSARRDEARDEDRDQEHELLLRRRASARIGVRASMRGARRRRARRAADDALGRCRRRRSAGAEQGRQSRLPVFSRARSPAARPDSRVSRSGQVDDAGAARRSSRTNGKRVRGADRVRSRRADRVTGRGRLLRARRAAARRRKVRRELGDG